MQQYVNNVKGSIDAKSEKERRLELQDKSSNAARKAKKEAAEARKRELELLFNEAKSSRDMQKVKDLLETRAEEDEQQKELDINDLDVPIEEWIEQERAKIVNKTPLTEALFKNWRAKQMNERAKDAADARKELSKRGLISGKEQFERDSSLATADDGSGAAFDKYDREVDDEAMLARAAKEAEILAERVAAELGISVEELQTGKKKEKEANGNGEEGKSELDKLVEAGGEDLDELLGDDDDELDDEELQALADEIEKKGEKEAD